MSVFCRSLWTLRIRRSVVDVEIISEEALCKWELDVFSDNGSQAKQNVKNFNLKDFILR